MDVNSKKIVLIGASVRALIPSALAAGLRPVCFDLFGDWDSYQYPLAKVHRLERYSRLLAIKFDADAGPALLSGGCELRADIVEYLDRQLGLCGHSADSLKATSNRFDVLAELEQAGLDVPMTRRSPPTGSPGDWLVKPLTGCGGTGIRDWGTSTDIDAGQRDSGPNQPGIYYQQRIIGETFSALFYSDCGRGVTWLIGLTRQLVGRSWAGAAPYAYCGSIHASLDQHPESEAIKRIGQVTGSRFSLQGLWGADLMMDGDRTFVVDVNVRIPASAELFETSIRLADRPQISSLVGLHVTDASYNELDQVCGRIAEMDQHRPNESKAVLFNKSPAEIALDRRIVESLIGRWHRDFFQSKHLAGSIVDLPQPGSRIQPGHPILTIRLRGGPDDVAEDQLIKKAAEIYRLLGLS